jgi:hypothetical protein
MLNAIHVFKQNLIKELTDNTKIILIIHSLFVVIVAFSINISFNYFFIVKLIINIVINI